MGRPLPLHSATFIQTWFRQLCAGNGCQLVKMPQRQLCVLASALLGRSKYSIHLFYGGFTWTGAGRKQTQLSESHSPLNVAAMLALVGGSYYLGIVI